MSVRQPHARYYQRPTRGTARYDEGLTGIHTIQLSGPHHPAVRAAAAELVARQPDAAELLAALGLDQEEAR